MLRTTVRLTAFLMLATPCLAAGWGSVEGQVVLDGNVPSVPPLVRKGDTTVKDAPVCAALDMVNDGMLFNKETNGVANVFVFMRKAPAQIHPDLKSSKEKQVVFDQMNCRFFPHCLIVRNDQVVLCKSSDAVAHNVHTNPFSNTPANFIVQPNDTKGIEVKMPQAERLPVKVVCDIHPWMLAWWVVVDHPYAAITDEKGNFKIENLPEGEHEFQVWHAKTGYIDRKLMVNIKGGQTTTQKPVKVKLDQFKD